MILKTESLLLRPFNLTDAPEVERLARDREIADMTNVPHPYPEGGAEEWIRSQKERKNHFNFAITSLENRKIVGTIHIGKLKDYLGEIGYWIGKNYWGKGYATEAVKEIIRFGFEDLDLKRITAKVLTRNSASMRVLEKAEFQREGILREHFYRWGKYEDVATYGLLLRELKRGQKI